MLPTDFNASINDKSGVRDPFGGGMSGFSKRHGSKVKIVEIFSMDRDGEIAAFEAHSAKGNRTLLWHGTNIAVAAAICSSGMRIMPNSGGRVGQGIYLANQSVKSGHYVQPAQDGTGIMFLAEAAMGTVNYITQDDSRLKLSRLPPGTDSVVALGRIDPDPAGDVAVEMDGNPVTIPAGAIASSTVPGAAKSTFTQSEHLIYREDQLRLRYLVRMQWSK